MLEYKGAKLEIDLGAERFIAAERDEEGIAVEIKGFSSSSALSEFHTAFGQYLNYRRALEQAEPLHKLFLAVSRDTFETFFQLLFTQEAVAFHNLALIVYQPITEVIAQWN
jgi:hypothetical protein